MRHAGLNPFVSNAGSTDIDNDGISDVREIMLATNPLRGDSDGDGVSDASELALNRSPRRYDTPEPRLEKYNFAITNLGSGSVIRGTTNSLGNLAKTGVPLHSSFSVTLLSSSSISEGGGSGNGSGSSILFGALTATASIAINGPGCYSFPRMRLTTTDSPDTDGDGLQDDAEWVIGTSAALADTDNDGIGDLSELRQGLDPLGGRGVATGVIASLSIQGAAKNIIVEGTSQNAQQQRAYIAAGTSGLAIVDATQFDKPAMLGQLTLPGDATDVDVDSASNIAVIASNDGGLHFVNVSDPMRPKHIRTADVVASQIEVIDSIAYAAVASQIVSYEALTGDLLGTLNIPNGAAITGMAHEGGVLFTMDANRNLRAFEITDIGLVARGSLQMTHGGGRISVANGVVYAAARPSFTQGGFATANVSNPNNLVELSASDVPGGFAAPGRCRRCQRFWIGTGGRSSGIRAICIVGRHGCSRSIEYRQLRHAVQPAGSAAGHRHRQRDWLRR